MGGLATDIADIAWITSDNPRTEDPDQIISEILTGCDSDQVELHPEPDRKAAIEKACAYSSGDDVIIIAGKGHEDYQLIGYTKYPFSDQVVLRELGAR